MRDVAWAPSIGSSRTIIASCSQDRRVIIWTNEGSSWTPKTLHTFDDVVWHVSWSVSGNMLAVSGGDNKVSLWKEDIQGNWSCISDVNNKAGPQGWLIFNDHHSFHKLLIYAIIVKCEKSFSYSLNTNRTAKIKGSYTAIFYSSKPPWKTIANSCFFQLK